MERKRNIVESINAPQPHDLWIHNGELKYYGPSGWVPFGDGEIKEQINAIKNSIEILSITVQSLSKDVQSLDGDIENIKSNVPLIKINETLTNTDVTDGSLDKLVDCKQFIIVESNGDDSIEYIYTKIPSLAMDENLAVFTTFSMGPSSEPIYGLRTATLIEVDNGKRLNVLDYSRMVGPNATESLVGFMSPEDKKIINQLKSFNQESSDSPFIIGDSTDVDILDTQILLTLGHNNSKTNLWILLCRCNETENQVLQVEYNNEIISEKQYYYDSHTNSTPSELFIWAISLPADAPKGSCSIHVS